MDMDTDNTQVLTSKGKGKNIYKLKNIQ